MGTSSSKWLLNVHIQKAQDILSDMKEGILWTINISFCIKKGSNYHLPAYIEESADLPIEDLRLLIEYPR
jgi:hypothetical protein